MDKSKRDVGQEEILRRSYDDSCVVCKQVGGETIGRNIIPLNSR